MTILGRVRFAEAEGFARIFTAEKGTQTTTSTMFIARIAPRAAPIITGEKVEPGENRWDKAREAWNRRA